jgi:hypothetical protein
MIAEVTYSRFGQTYKERFDPIQAKNELLRFGYPGAKNLTDLEALKAIHEIFNQ